MKKTRFILVSIVVLVLAIFSATMLMAGSGDAVETIADGPGANPGGPIAAPVAYAPTGSILHDNGPLITHPAGGAGGADASALQSALGMNVYGFAHATTGAFRVADDFTVTDPNGWQVDSFVFYAYQTGSTTASTINSINFRIWDGIPGAGGTVIFGDTTTNRFAATQWSNIYRSIDTDVMASNRPIMATEATAGVVLPAGTYWIDWQTGGTLASGPWAPAITIAGSTAVGNGLQYSGTAWGPLLDNGTAGAQQGLPFQVIGEPVAAGLPSIVLTKTVGTDGGSCATTTSTSVGYGSTVYYCYTVQNTGNVTLTHHTLTDDVLGTVLGPGFVYNLAPGASAFITESYVVMTDTITNNALWTAYISGTNTVATATASATVTGQPTDVSLTGFAGQTSGSTMLLVLVVLTGALLGAALYIRRQWQD